MIVGLLLAAGESSRMGSPKPLLEWHGKPLIQYQVQQLKRGGCDEVIVVLGHCADRVMPFVDGLGVRVVVNPRYREGRATSVRTGALAAPAAANWVAVLSVDQPRPSNIIAQVLRAAHTSQAAIVMPVYQGRHGHPTAFAGRLLPELTVVQDATLGLRAVVQRHQDEVQEVEVASDLILLDINTPEEYQAARYGPARSAGGRAPVPAGR